MPHFALGYDVDLGSGAVEPFISFDCVTNWQKKYNESGSSTLNMKVESARSWMFRTELGCNGYYERNYGWGEFILGGKLSWINKNPHSQDMTAALVGAPGSFVIETLTQNQNLFSPAIEIFFKGKRGVFGSISYDGEFGSGYFTNEAMGNIGWYF